MSRTWMSGRLFGAGVIVSAAVGAGFVAPGSALAATTCAAPPGAVADVVQVEAVEACGATSDGTGGAWSHGDAGVGFAQAEAGATVGAAGFGGGVGAGESRAGRLLVVGYGFQSLALGVLDLPGTALVLTGPQSQAFIGDADDPVLCEGDLAAAVNIDTGRGCIVIGDFRYMTPSPDIAPAGPTLP